MVYIKSNMRPTIKIGTEEIKRLLDEKTGAVDDRPTLKIPIQVALQLLEECAGKGRFTP